MMKNVLLGLLMMGAGAAMIVRAYPIIEFFGKSEWAERNLGGTRNLLILIGFGLIVLGGLAMFGVFQMGEVDGGTSVTFE